MRRAWLAVPALLLVVSCHRPDLAASYRQAASRLSFRLERVEPRLDMALPLDRSKLVVRMVLRVDNPSDVHFHARRIVGDLGFEEMGQLRRVGSVDLPQGVDLAPRATSPMVLDLTFAYGDLRRNWAPISQVVHQGDKAVWRLEGKASLDAFGIPITVPFHTRHQRAQ
ncbi:LEA type 2 family protein [Holophaga foetida]|uniref:NDR1/HIN1-like protein n=1 Tax=Holophaga foetida TaxID=35839 RepID=UPI0002472102|nr:LEA type 2 family protein [Holophaga foetida]